VNRLCKARDFGTNYEFESINPTNLMFHYEYMYRGMKFSQVWLLEYKNFVLIPMCFKACMIRKKRFCKTFFLLCIHAVVPVGTKYVVTNFHLLIRESET
jgi:hypothetical protein